MRVACILAARRAIWYERLRWEWIELRERDSCWEWSPPAMDWQLWFNHWKPKLTNPKHINSSQLSSYLSAFGLTWRDTVAGGWWCRYGVAVVEWCRHRLHQAAKLSGSKLPDLCTLLGSRGATYASLSDIKWHAHTSDLNDNSHYEISESEINQFAFLANQTVYKPVSWPLKLTSDLHLQCSHRVDNLFV